MQVLIAGGSGFLGSALRERLRQHGHTVAILTRRAHTASDVEWDPAGGDTRWTARLEHADAVVNLTGASLNRRWTEAHKREMWDSRIGPTRALAAAITKASRPPAVFVSGSGVGVYGARGDETLTEDAPAGNDFLGTLAAAWEREARAAASATRVVLFRTGIVLDRRQGALPQMALPFRLFAGGPIGSGRQFISWIHREDWVSMACWALEHAAVHGALNATSPHPVSNREFSHALGEALKRPSWIPAPAPVLRLVLGEMAELVLTGQRAVPAKAQSLGFQFRYPTLDAALGAELG